MGIVAVNDDDLHGGVDIDTLEDDGCIECVCTITVDDQTIRVFQAADAELTEQTQRCAVCPLNICSRILLYPVYFDIDDEAALLACLVAHINQTNHPCPEVVAPADNDSESEEEEAEAEAASEHESDSDAELPPDDDDDDDAAVDDDGEAIFEDEGSEAAESDNNSSEESDDSESEKPPPRKRRKKN